MARIVITRRLYKPGMFVINNVLLSLTGAVTNDITGSAEFSYTGEFGNTVPVRD